MGAPFAPDPHRRYTGPGCCPFCGPPQPRRGLLYLGPAGGTHAHIQCPDCALTFELDTGFGKGRPDGANDLPAWP